MAVKFAAAYGCDVTAFTSSESKFEEAKGFGANQVVSSRDSGAIGKLAGKLDLLISTVNVKLDWDAMINALAPQRAAACRRCGDGTDTSRGILTYRGPAQRLRFADGFASGDRIDARLCFAPQHCAADGALSHEQNQRSFRAT